MWWIPISIAGDNLQLSGAGSDGHHARIDERHLSLLVIGWDSVFITCKVSDHSIREDEISTSFPKHAHKIKNAKARQIFIHLVTYFAMIQKVLWHIVKEVRFVLINMPDRNKSDILHLLSLSPSSSSILSSQLVVMHPVSCPSSALTLLVDDSWIRNYT